jgi:hypothetical protein
MFYTISMTTQQTKSFERLATESADLARKSLKKRNEQGDRIWRRCLAQNAWSDCGKT